MRDDSVLHVLLIYRRLIPSVRLCGHCQLEYLSQQGKLEYRAKQERKLRKEDLSWADTVLFIRTDSRYEYKLMALLRKAGKRTVYVLDDDLLCVPPQSASAIYFDRLEIRKYVQMMLEMSSAILSPSPVLLEKYVRTGQEAILLEEPAVMPQPFEAHDPHRPVRIGFAGSVDRAADIDELLREALVRIKAEYAQRVELYFFGAIPSFARGLDAKSIPYCASYEGYRRQLNALAWDIGLAPMPDTPFHACKHYNKFVEYAAAGIVGVFSDVMPYTRLRGQKDACVLCENTAEAWYRAIKELIDDPALRERMRLRCAALARGTFGVKASAEQLYAQLCTAAAPPSAKLPADGLKHSLAWLRMENWVDMVLRRVRCYGVRLPLVAAKRIFQRLGQ